MAALSEYFRFLDDLRASGKTNMWGAPSYLEKHFGIDRTLSHSIFLKWQRTFDEKQTAAERAAQASL